MKNVVDFLKIAEKLECECRITRTSDGAFQSVASHSWNMAMMAMAFKPYLQTPVNMERVLELCLLHDLPEAVAHDIPLHLQTPEIKQKKNQEEKIVVDRFSELLKDSDICDLFEEYEERKTQESKLVKALDILDTCVAHLCAKDLKYVGEYANNFYWKLFFSDDFEKSFDFEPVLIQVFGEIKKQVSERLKTELNIDSKCFIKE